MANEIHGDVEKNQRYIEAVFARLKRAVDPTYLFLEEKTFTPDDTIMFAAFTLHDMKDDNVTFLLIDNIINKIKNEPIDDGTTFYSLGMMGGKINKVEGGDVFADGWGEGVSFQYPIKPLPTAYHDFDSTVSYLWETSYGQDIIIVSELDYILYAILKNYDEVGHLLNNMMNALMEVCGYDETWLTEINETMKTIYINLQQHTRVQH